MRARRAPRGAAIVDMPVTASWHAGPARWSLLVHGGAGDVALGAEQPMIEGCRHAAAAAAAILSAGGTSLDAVQRAVEVLEDNPLFNAGVGSALNSEGDVELDAAIMEGATLRAGAVCAIRGFAHPIAVARAALEDGRHILYAASGAERFAREMGLSSVPPESLVTERAREKLRKSAARTSSGTVGAVARDSRGILAAATSTGGTTGKRPGRVGDSPVLGAGTYANTAGAGSATGHGEGILRVALTITAIDLLATTTPEAAAAEALSFMKTRVGATGGLILIDVEGRLACARTTPSMSWAAVWDGGNASGC